MLIAFPIYIFQYTKNYKTYNILYNIYITVIDYIYINTFCSIKEAEVELLAVFTLFVGGGEVDCCGFTKVDNAVEDFVVWVFSNGTIGGDKFCSGPLITPEEVEVPASPTGGPGPGTLGDCVLLDKAGKVVVRGAD